MDAVTFARKLRRDLTPAERRLWGLLRNRALGVKFYRQSPRGPYVLDFVCMNPRIVVEVDGSQHADSPKDAVRDAWLEDRGFRVLRFWNHDVLQNPDGVCRAIVEAIQNSQPKDPPLSSVEERVPSGG